jgi:hypothetical protein
MYVHAAESPTLKANAGVFCPEPRNNFDGACGVNIDTI